MMFMWIWFIAGMMVGGTVGFFCAAAFQLSGRPGQPAEGGA